MDTTSHGPAAAEARNFAESCFQQRQLIQGGKADFSRRSIDWRDSGIVIDEDNHLFEALCSFDTRSSIDSEFNLPTSSGTTSARNATTCCATQDIVLEQDDDGDTLLHLAVVGLTVDKVRDLINFCDLNAINNMMQTPLHVAVLANRPEMVQILVDSRAKLNVHDRRGNTPLHLAVQRGLIAIVQIILDAAANKVQEGLTAQQTLEAYNFDGYTSLHLAAINDRRDVLELLANKYGADLNCRDSKSGETIMHKAIRQLNVGLVAFISSLSNDKHCNGNDFAGRKPLDTVQVLNEACSMKANESSKLTMIKELIEVGISRCIERGGCCSEREAGRDVCSSEVFDYSSSSSEDSESEHEID